MTHLHRHILGLFTFVLCLGLIGCNGSDKKESSRQKTSAKQDTTEMQMTSSDHQKLNMNNATDKQFRHIPNVGDRMLHEFKEYRPYVSIDQFRKEIGKYVDEQQVAMYEKYIYVPIRPNKSDIETLMQIPGLTKEQAQKVIDRRPYKNKQSFFEVIGNDLTGLQLEMAKTYTVAK